MNWNSNYIYKCTVHIKTLIIVQSTYSHAVQRDSLDDFKGSVSRRDSVSVHQEICELKKNRSIKMMYNFSYQIKLCA